MLDNARPEVVTFGEVLAAFVARDLGSLSESASFTRHIVGAESNAAAGLARLGHPSAFIGRVGADGLGQAALRRLRGEGVDVHHVTVDAEAPTGVLIRGRRGIGPTEVVYARRGSAGSRLDPMDIEAAVGLFAGARWLHVTGVTPAISASARAATDRAVELARRRGLRVSLDVNLRRKLWSQHEARDVLSRLATAADVVIAGRDEAGLLLGSSASTDSAANLADGLLRLGPSTAVIKLGADGAYARSSDGVTASRGAPSSPAIDLVGAGDAFSAGFIAATLEGRTLEEALAVGNACGAAVVSVIGDIEGMPTRDELASLLAGGDAETLR